MTAASRPQENTKLLAVLGAVMSLAVVAFLYVSHRLLVGWPVIAAVTMPWAAFSLALRLRHDTWGRELPVLDWWSVPHAGTGALLALFGVGWVIVAIIAVLWEAVELICRVKEYPVNRAADIVLAFGGWILANVLAAGPFAAW